MFLRIGTVSQKKLQYSKRSVWFFFYSPICYCIKINRVNDFFPALAHCLVPTFPGSECGFKGLPCWTFGVMPASVALLSSTFFFGEVLFCVCTVTGFLAVSWKSNLFIYIQVVAMEQTAARWHAVAKLICRPELLSLLITLTSSYRRLELCALVFLSFFCIE